MLLWGKAVQPEHICPQYTLRNGVQHKSMAAPEISMHGALTVQPQ